MAGGRERAYLVVADPTRSENTICLAITPAMKALGIRKRCLMRDIPKDVNYVTAMARMRRYMEVSAKVYSTYLRYVSADDAWPYGVDEAFPDVAGYLGYYGTDARGLAGRIMADVLDETGVSATAGIGPNLFLCKVALDHAWGQEPATIADCRSCVPRGQSMSNGQVLMRDCATDEARTVLREMVWPSCLDLRERRLSCGSVGVWVGYSGAAGDAHGHGGGTRRLCHQTSSAREIEGEALAIYDGREEALADAVARTRARFGPNAVIPGHEPEAGGQRPGAQPPDWGTPC